MTVIELSVVLALLGLVIASILAVLNSAQSNFQREVSRATSNDQLRLAAESIDREVRSGDVLYDPATENYASGDVAPGMSLRIYTESNSPSRNGAWCIQWRITTTGKLQERRWISDWSSTSDNSQYISWRTVATGLTNRTENIAAFSRPSGVLNLINIRLRDNNDSTKGVTVEVDQSVSGRNTQFYSASSYCGPATPDPAISGPSMVPPY
jgi:hypothetical protein